MIHFENKALNLAARQAEPAMSWSMQVVMHWLGGEALDEAQQQIIISDLRSSPDSNLQAGKLEAAEDIPYAAFSLDIVTRASELDETAHHQDYELTDIARANLPKEVALRKGISPAIGALAAAGIGLELLELEAAFLVEDNQLASDRSEAGNNGLFVTAERYNVEELAHSIFSEESAARLELDNEFEAFLQELS